MMKESVSAIFVCGDEFFIIKRADNLAAFPGYFSFPGGKVDQEDRDAGFENEFGIETSLFTALVREVKEELGVDLLNLISSNIVTNISLLGLAITPDFNPHRFKNFYFKIFVDQKIDFTLEHAEIESASWYNCKKANELYHLGHMLVVPPMITIIEDLAKDINSISEVDPNLKYDSNTQVPMICPVNGVNQYLPLSNTFPPANRTNSFFIGDKFKVLIDPSPKDDSEFLKLKNSLKSHSHVPDLIFLTHHHPDHHQYSVDLARELKIPMGMSKDTFERLTKIFGDSYFFDLKINYFKEGDILTHSQGHKVNIIHTPGHDEGQLTVVRDDLAWAIVSDLIQTIGTVVVGGEEGDMKKYFESLERMIALNPKVVIPSHGIAIGGIVKLKQTLAHRIEREESVRALLSKGFDTEQMLAAIYPDLPERLHKYARATIVAHIKKIKQE